MWIPFLLLAFIPAALCAWEDLTGSPNAVNALLGLTHNVELLTFFVGGKLGGGC